VTNDYLADQADADELIEEFGQAAILTRGATDHPATVVVLDYANREVDGTRIQATDKRVLVAAGGLEITPKPSDRLKIDGTGHAIVQVKPFAPAGIVVFFEVQARK